MPMKPPVTADSLAGGIRRAHAAFQDKPLWHNLQHSGMSTDVSWRSRAGRYAELYRELFEMRYR